MSIIRIPLYSQYLLFSIKFVCNFLLKIHLETVYSLRALHAYDCTIGEIKWVITVQEESGRGDWGEGDPYFGNKFLTKVL